MKKRRITPLLCCLAMLLSLLPVQALADSTGPAPYGSATTSAWTADEVPPSEEPPVCLCETPCSEEGMNADCPVCGAEGAMPEACGQYAAPETPPEADGVPLPAEPLSAANAGQPVPLAADHSHPICGSSCGDGGNHNAVTWQEWPSDNAPVSGNYYLTGKVEVPRQTSIEITGDVNLCLNGFEITGEVSNGLFRVKTGGTLTICDCTSRGKLTVDPQNNPVIMYGGGVLNLYSGTITAAKTAIGTAMDNINDRPTGRVNIYGGTVESTDSSGYQGINAVNANKGFQVNIYGGSVRSGRYAVNLGSIAKLTLSGKPTLSGKTAALLLYTKANTLLTNAKVDATGYTGGALKVQENTSPSSLEGAYAIKGDSAGKFTLVNSSDTHEYAYRKSGGYWIQEKGSHVHPVCGDPCTDGDRHTDVDWTAWDGTGGITSSGNYYLTGDVTASGNITISAADVHICLNDHTLNLDDEGYLTVSGNNVSICDCQGSGTITGSRNHSSYAGSGHLIKVSGTGFALYGGTITNTSENSSGHSWAIFADTGAELTMLGGTVNRVKNMGSITMTGGKLEGGFLDNNGNFEMTSGTIYAEAGKTAISNGGTATITGSAVVTGEGTGNRAAIEETGTLTVSGNASVTSPSSYAINVQSRHGSLTLSDAPTIQGEGEVALKLWTDWSTTTADVAKVDATDYKGNALRVEESSPTSMANGYAIKGGNGKFTLVHDIYEYVYENGGYKVQKKHVHKYTYSVSGATITERCDCDHFATVTLTLTGEDSFTYTGNEIKPAKITYSDGWAGGENLEITYENNIDAGRATASITVNNATASVDFTITPAPITGTVTIQIEGATKPESTLTANYSGNAEGSVAYQWYRGENPISGATDSAYELTATDVGNRIKVEVKGTGNYSGSVTSTPTAAVSKIEQTAPDKGEGYTIDYDGEAITITNGYEVSTKHDGSGEAVTSGDLSNYFGQTLYIRKAGTDTKEASGWTEIPVAARPAKPNAPTVDGVTTNSVTVPSSDEKLEYALVEEGQTPGAADWKKGTGSDLTFTNLKDGTEYELYARVPSTDDAPASLLSDGKAVKTLTALTGTVTITGDAQFDETLTATYTDSGDETVAYQWYRGETPIEGATESTYTLTADDIGETIQVVVTGTGSYGGSVTSGPTAAVSKIEQPAPIEGAGYTIDYGKETITILEGYEVFTKKDDIGEEITSGDLAGHFGETIYIRKAETATQKPSEWVAISVTKRPDAPNAPTVGGSTTNSITITGSDAALEYAAVKNGQSLDAADWTKGTGESMTFTGLEIGTEYEIYVRVPSTNSAPASQPSEAASAETLVPAGAVDVSGAVTGSGNAPAEGVEVTLKQGNDVIKSTTTEANGAYSFTGIPAGVYNIVAVDGDGTTMTILVTVGSANLADQNIELPDESSGSVNSIVKVEESAPPIVAGGVEDVAEEEAGDAVAEGKSVTVTLTVKKEENTEKQGAVDAAIPDNIQKDVLYLDFSLTKTTTESGGTPSDPELISETKTVLEIVVPYDFEGKATVAVYRQHGSEEAKALSAVSDQPKDPADGTFWADRSGGNIHIYATKFSTYAIAYTVYSGSGSVTYPPSVETAQGGDVTVSPKNPERGDEVTITPKPEEGYEAAEVIVTDRNGEPVEVEQNEDGTWSFLQPSGKVTIEVVFHAIDPIADCPRDDTCPMARFTDVNMGAWYHDGVHYCIENGLMVGTGADTFSPEGITTRGQVVTILWRLSGSPAVNCRMDFEDVPAGAYYTEAVSWAASEGVVGGYGNGKFGPDDPITREQLAAMLFRYAQRYGYDVSVGEDTNTLSYTDFGQISEYAIPAFQWACGAGVIKGTSASTLSPQGQVARAQAAEMLMRFCRNSK